MYDEIYDYNGRLLRYIRGIKTLRNGDLALNFLDHLRSLGLSTVRISSYAAHILALLKVADCDLQTATRADFEKIVAGINSQHCLSGRSDKRFALKKLIQYAKYGSSTKGTPYSPEVNWIKLRVNERKAVRVTPDKLLSVEDFEALVKAADNRRDKATLHVLFEAALRPGELLTMKVGSVSFNDDHCLISVNGKTGIKRVPLVVSYRPLLEWLERHSRKDDPDAPLWASLGNNSKGDASATITCVSSSNTRV